MIINRYLIGTMTRPFAAALGVLVVLFASFNLAGFLAQAANGLLPAASITELVVLKVLIALDVLAPMALYVSVFLGLSRLYGDGEITAMLALRITPQRVGAMVMTISLGLALVVGGLSLVIRPLAYQRLHWLSTQSQTMIDVQSMEAGTFYQDQRGGRVIFLGQRPNSKSPAQDILMVRRLTGRLEVTHGQRGYLLPQAAGGGERVYVGDVRVYQIGRDAQHGDQVLSAGGITLNPEEIGDVPPDHSAIAASSRRLLGSHVAEDAAELQWRLSTPLSTLLLGMLGFLMSRPRRQQGSALKIATMILIYFSYDLLLTSARAWVQHGAIATFPGIWWVPALLGACLAGALYGPERRADWRRA